MDKYLLTNHLSEGERNYEICFPAFICNFFLFKKSTGGTSLVVQ